LDGRFAYDWINLIDRYHGRSNETEQPRYPANDFDGRLMQCDETQPAQLRRVQFHPLKPSMRDPCALQIIGDQQDKPTNDIAMLLRLWPICASQGGHERLDKFSHQLARAPSVAHCDIA